MCEGADGGEQEGNGDLLAESEEVKYECGALQKYAILFEVKLAVQGSKDHFCAIISR